jgi:hypothetical protein
MTSTVHLKHGENDGITVYIPKKTILKEMAAKIKLSQYFFSDLVQVLSDTPCVPTLIYILCSEEVNFLSFLQHFVPFLIQNHPTLPYNFRSVEVPRFA